jgi:hypothetical protein
MGVFGSNGRKALSMHFVPMTPRPWLEASAGFESGLEFRQEQEDWDGRIFADHRYGGEVVPAAAVEVPDLAWLVKPLDGCLPTDGCLWPV